MKRVLLLLLLLMFLQGFAQQQPAGLINPNSGDRKTHIIVPRDIHISDYFTFIDSLAASCGFNEHLLVNANPWLIDSLAATDYYIKKQQGFYIYDQKQWVILPAGARVEIPGPEKAYEIAQQLAQTNIEVNIPEFRLRLFRADSLLYEFPIRVGQNKKKYLAMSKRVTDLRTIPGKGTVVRHERNPVFYNPVNYHRFYMTYRDDDSLTVMPQIPWIETEINGLRNGQMIHPTTNPETLEKAYSNGCIGLREGDAWIVYYHAPIGTQINILYRLEVSDPNGGTRVVPDIYGWAH